MTDGVTQELAEFFEYIWGDKPVLDKPTFVYLPVKSADRWVSFMFEWPRQKAGIVRHVLKWTATGNEIYYSPSLFKTANPKKDGVLGSWVLWVDFDGNAPARWSKEPTGEAGEVFVPPPTLIVQSSIPGHEHCYWKLSEFLEDPLKLEDRNRSLAYVLHADTSGWDADQVLRPPHTTNQKRQLPVTIKEWDR